jgi:hypothetical protein
LEVALLALRGQAAGTKGTVRDILQNKMQQLKERFFKAISFLSPSQDAVEFQEKQQLA